MLRIMCSLPMFILKLLCGMKKKELKSS
ncbi:hypothetical protein NC651_002500 [Populus alba x Populus x berolinensis]|nr:hypothetical protein NC651_002500 [Populus alba x Populus x berolinensis]